MKIYKKLAEIKKKVGVMKKDTKGYNYKYFDINQMLEKLEPLLAEQDLILLQPIENGAVRTQLIDIVTGEIAHSSMELPKDVKPQDMGSAITYYRRYTLVSLLALQAEDDDGAVAQGAKSPVKRNFAPNSTPTKGYTTVAEQKAYVAKNKADQEAGVSPF